MYRRRKTASTSNLNFLFCRSRYLWKALLSRPFCLAPGDWRQNFLSLSRVFANCLLASHLADRAQREISPIPSYCDVSFFVYRFAWLSEARVRLLSHDDFVFVFSSRAFISGSDVPAANVKNERGSNSVRQSKSSNFQSQKKVFSSPP